MGTLIPKPPPTSIEASPVKTLAMLLERIGWTILELDIDMYAETATISLLRTDGRAIFGSVTKGRGTVERLQHERVTDRPTGRRTMPAERIKVHFLGRSPVAGPRVMLRVVSRYLADNPAPRTPELTTAEIRRCMAPLLTLTENT